MNRKAIIAALALGLGVLGAGVWKFSGERGGATEPLSTPGGAQTVTKVAAPTAGPVSAPASPVATQAATNPIIAESRKDVTAIITEPGLDNATAVKEILAVLPSLPQAEQAAAARHVADLSDDEAAQNWSKAVVQNTLPAEAEEVLFTELCNRPDTISYPALAAIADNPKHPKNQDSIDLLGTLLGEPDAGTSWSQQAANTLKASQGL